MITPTLITNLAWKGYLIFMALNFSFVPLVYFCYPETANLTLEEIDYLFASKEEGAVKMSIQVAKHGWGTRLERAGEVEKAKGGRVETRFENASEGSTPPTREPA